MIWMIPACFFLLFIQSPPEVVLNGVQFRQGETIRVKVVRDEEKCSVVFDQIDYPLYPHGSSRVCLIGLPADFPAGEHVLEVLAESKRWSGRVEVKANDYPTQKIVLPPEKASLLKLDIGDEREVIREALRVETDERFWDSPFSVPVYGELTSPYGARRNRSFHRGLDISADRGTSVQAPAGGYVTVSQDFPIHGKTVVLDHGHGVCTVYCHLDTIFVEEGDTLDRGSVLGRVGDTGYSTAPHLHWGLYVHGVPVNPSLWLTDDY
jgi:murein DD-endopeptidase MepM/ murein hydrolase activator NlpD